MYKIDGIRTEKLFKDDETFHDLYNTDCLTLMKAVPDNKVDLTVTSPPYDNMRSYKGSLVWNEEVFQEIADELYRITAKGGIVVWVVGDGTKNGSESGTSFKQALYFKEIGFNLHDTMIYKKDNYLPLNHNRYDPEFEYMFVFSKGKPKTFNPLMQPCKTAGAKYNYAGRSSGSTEESGAAMRQRDEPMVTNDFKYRGNIWGYETGKHKGSKDNIWKHPATFPEKLAEDHILSWSNEGDLIFDPFMGSATTNKMAYMNKRNSFGSEKVDEYYDISVERMKTVKRTNLPKGLFDV